ncbi:MAG: T9SS type A sorting domain-containing protein [Flavobacteriales bacterium]|nr:T9SS type A sorting domain-containing protein [Flavobacteriales bacterium]
MRAFFISLLLAVPFCLQAQSRYIPSENIETGYASFVFHLDEGLFKADLSAKSHSSKGTPTSFFLPLPSGESLEVSIEESPIMAKALQMKFPEIKSYKISGEGIYGRMGFTYKGFHGMIFTPDGTVYIDNLVNTNAYHSYYRHDYMAFYEFTKGHQCLVDDDHTITIPSNLKHERKSGETLRTYRLALACTGEYASFHGGTVNGALSGMVGTMNRVNGVYEKDFAVTMEIIANNDTIIFLDANNDPYSNFSGFAMLGQNQSAITSYIGTSNFDIGHVFSTGGGGVASLSSVCSSSNKARGVTGNGSPTGDAFDIDYVAHEMGHQFGANHTQNNDCNRVSSAAYEPGSASTIMGYAGICSPNLQNNSDDYFHAGSYDEIMSNVEFGSGSSCDAATSTGNTAPTVNVGTGGFHIPIETPFVLAGSASDPDGDNLSYCWEEMDLGPSGNPQSPNGNAPIFRSWSPSSSNERTCPRIASVITGSLVIGETYPTYSRDLNFRLTVRDQNSAGGGVEYDEISFDVDGNSGPFVVTTPESGESVETGNSYLIEWDVAGTDQSPVNCQNVHIELCNFSGGQLNVQDTLKDDTPNDGEELVSIPTSWAGTGNKYIRVRAADNIFFSLNGGAFTLTNPTAPQGAEIVLVATPDYANSTVQLNWNDSFSNESHFMIERSLGSNSNFILMDSVPMDSTMYIDVNAIMTGNNFYRVYAKNFGGNSAFSNEVTYDPLGANYVSQNENSIFPNPTNGSATLRLGTIQGTALAVLLNSQGQFVKSYDVKTGDTQLNLSGLAFGHYVLSIQSETSHLEMAIELIQQ